MEPRFTGPLPTLTFEALQQEVAAWPQEFRNRFDAMKKKAPADYNDEQATRWAWVMVQSYKPVQNKGE